MKKLILILLCVLIYENDASCVFKSAKWAKVDVENILNVNFYNFELKEKPKVSSTSGVKTNQVNKVLVDWSQLINNKE